MMGADLFSLMESARSHGDAAGEACSDKAERETEFDREAASAAIVAYLRTAGRPVSGEELTDHCIAIGIRPHDGRAFGPVFGGLVRSGAIVCAGFAMRRKGNGTAGARLWTLAAETA
jgi:hypothetical protein